MKFILLLLLNIFFLNAAEPLVVYKNGDDWIVLDSDGKEMFRKDNIYSMEGYREGMFRVQLLEDDDVVWAFLDVKGNVMLKPDHDEVFDFYDGMAMTATEIPESKIEKLYGFINKKGEQIEPNVYIDAIAFTDGLAYIMNDNRRGYINPKGEMVLPLPDSLVGYPFSENKAAVSNIDYFVGYINKKGKVIIPIEYEEFGLFKQGRVKFTKDGKTGVIDSNNNVIVGNSYYEVQEYSEGRTFISIPGERLQHLWALVDLEGNFLTGHIYKYANGFSEGLASVKDEKEWMFIDKQGKVVLRDFYRYAGLFVNGLAWVSKYNDDGSAQAGFIDTSGNWVIRIDDFEEALDLRLNQKMY